MGAPIQNIVIDLIQEDPTSRMDYTTPEFEGLDDKTH
jgi:hypothetical protein